ncbi:MAG TPA: hypothetical protein P5228_05105 [Bacteroidales bacterium]|nr:hypothetical protein [Bacteroidales bacterium]
MNLNWKDSFKEKSSDRLFEIFSEKERINIDPQIFAGNILFDRNYEIERLTRAKSELIDSIEDAFSRKYNTNPQKIKKENTIRELIIRSIIALTVFWILINSNDISLNYFSATINHKTVAIIFGLINFLPLFWLNKHNNKAIEKVERETEKKRKLIHKINAELKF